MAPPKSKAFMCVAPCLKRAGLESVGIGSARGGPCPSLVKSGRAPTAATTRMRGPGRASRSQFSDLRPAPRGAPFRTESRATQARRDGSVVESPAHSLPPRARATGHRGWVPQELGQRMAATVARSPRTQHLRKPGRGRG